MASDEDHGRKTWRRIDPSVDLEALSTDPFLLLFAVVTLLALSSALRTPGFSRQGNSPKPFVQAPFHFSPLAGLTFKS
jgi:hypothetical protein